jgi:hypothetical protein
MKFEDFREVENHTWKTEVVYCFEASVPYYQPTRYHNLEIKYEV